MFYDNMKNQFQLIDTSDAVKHNRKRYNSKLADDSIVKQLIKSSIDLASLLNRFPNTAVVLLLINENQETFTIKGTTNLIQFNTTDFTESDFLKAMWDVIMENYGGNAINMAAINISSRLQPILIPKNDNETWAVYYTIFWNSYNKTEHDLYLNIIKLTLERLFKLKGK